MSAFAESQREGGREEGRRYKCPHTASAFAVSEPNQGHMRSMLLKRQFKD
jgi:hypothetical protein